jgi:hypothetical protein
MIKPEYTSDRRKRDGSSSSGEREQEKQINKKK